MKKYKWAMIHPKYRRGIKKTLYFTFRKQKRNYYRACNSENVLPKTIIGTDEWRCYYVALRTLNSSVPDYVHETINYSINFVDPSCPSIHTQSTVRVKILRHLKKKFFPMQNQTKYNSKITIRI